MRFPYGMPVFHFMLFAIATTGTVTAQTAANALFDDTRVQIVNVTMDPGDWASLQQNYLLDTYYAATMTWNGISVGLGVRSHGDGSRSGIKPNLDFNFAHYTKNQTFLGIGFVLMKANNEDPSNLREWMSMKLYRAMGLTASREAPAQIFVNGQLLGMYFIVEHLDDKDGAFLQRNFGESGGYLYEWDYGQSYEFGNLGADPNAYSPFLELKSNQTSADLQTFANFIQAVNAPVISEASYVSALSAFIDPKLFLTYCATENVLADIDGVLGGEVGLNNFYLYQFQNSTRYQLIPWDKDLTFFDPSRPILYGVNSGTNIDVLAQALCSFPDYKAVYLSELTRAATLLGGVGGWADNEITREWSVIGAAALNDPNKQCGLSGVQIPCGVPDTLSGLNSIYGFLEQRSVFVLSSALSAGYAPVTTAPQIQRVSVYPPGSSVFQLSPGALATAGGTNLGAAGQPLAQTALSPLPRLIGSAFVAIEGVRVPLLSTSPDSIAFQVPQDQASDTTAHVVISVNGAMSNAAAVDMWPTSPAILAVERANGSVVAPGNAPTAGEVLSIYAIGLGAVTPDVPLGGVPAAGSLATTIVTPQITLGSTPLNVLFSGLSPAFTGLYQINVRMPASLPQGASAQLTLVDAGAADLLTVPLQ